MSYRVRPFQCGEVLAPGPAIYLLRDYGEWCPLGVWAWLVEGAGRRILIDTGLGDPSVINATREPHRQWRAVPLTSLLAEAGVAPESIDTVVLSHLHHDHAGAVASFPNAAVVLAEREWEFVRNPPHPALAPHPLFPRDVVDYLASLSRGRLRLVSDGCEVAPGIRVMVLGAHTPGSMAVEIASESGPVIVAGDVVFTRRNFEETIPVGTLLDVPQWYAARERLAASGATILPSHEPALRFP